MVEKIINILNENIGGGDHISEALEINNIINANNGVNEIYLADRIQVLLLKNKCRFIDFDICYNILKCCKEF